MFNPYSPPAESSPLLSSRADFIIKTLQLSYLPKESGYIGLLGRSPHNVTPTPSAQETANDATPAGLATTLSASLAAQSHNYYMLTRQLPVNYLHLLAPDDTHILIEGGPVEYYVFTPPGHPSLLTSSSPKASSPKAEKMILGRDYAAGQTPIVSVPGGCWKALRLCDGVDYALMANVLAPEFTEDRVSIGAGRPFLEMFQGRETWANEDFLRGLVGEENWIEEA